MADDAHPISVFSQLGLTATRKLEYDDSRAVVVAIEEERGQDKEVSALVTDGRGRSPSEKRGTENFTPPLLPIRGGRRIPVRRSLPRRSPPSPPEVGRFGIHPSRFRVPPLDQGDIGDGAIRAELERHRRPLERQQQTDRVGVGVDTVNASVRPNPDRPIWRGGGILPRGHGVGGSARLLCSRRRGLWSRVPDPTPRPGGESTTAGAILQPVAIVRAPVTTRQREGGGRRFRILRRRLVGMGEGRGRGGVGGGRSL